MSREIEFRGLPIAGGGFVYGSLIETTPNKVDGNHTAWVKPKCALGLGALSTPTESLVMVKAKTVGQFTGLLDCNGVKIFEGDIIQSYHFTDENRKDYFLNHIVEWSDKLNGWFMRNGKDLIGNDGSIQMWVYMKSSKYTAKVIGNIHKNPELLP